MTRRLFALPTEVKERYPLDPAKNIGWEWQSQVRPSTGFPDQKESMCVGVLTNLLSAVCLAPNQIFRISLLCCALALSS